MCGSDEQEKKYSKGGYCLFGMLLTSQIKGEEQRDHWDFQEEDN